MGANTHFLSLVQMLKLISLKQHNSCKQNHMVHNGEILHVYKRSEYTPSVPSPPPGMVFCCKTTAWQCSCGSYELLVSVITVYMYHWCAKWLSGSPRLLLSGAFSSVSQFSMSVSVHVFLCGEHFLIKGFWSHEIFVLLSTSLTVSRHLQWDLFRVRHRVSCGLWAHSFIFVPS